MNGFALPRNFTEDLKKLLRKNKFIEARDKFESPSRTPSAAQASSLEEPALTLEEEFEEQAEKLGGNLAPVFEDMAEKTMRVICPNNNKHPDWTSSQHWGEWIRAQACSHHHGSRQPILWKSS